MINQQSEKCDRSCLQLENRNSIEIPTDTKGENQIKWRYLKQQQKNYASYYTCGNDTLLLRLHWALKKFLY